MSHCLINIMLTQTKFAVGRRATVMECQYGPRRKGAVNKKQPDYNEHGSPVKKHRPTCPARIYIKKVRKFPEFRIDPTLDAKHVRQAQERALTALRLAGVDIGGEERYSTINILIMSVRLLCKHC